MKMFSEHPEKFLEREQVTNCVNVLSRYGNFSCMRERDRRKSHCVIGMVNLRKW